MLEHLLDGQFAHEGFLHLQIVYHIAVQDEIRAVGIDHQTLYPAVLGDHFRIAVKIQHHGAGILFFRPFGQLVQIGENGVEQIAFSGGEHRKIVFLLAGLAVFGRVDGGEKMGLICDVIEGFLLQVGVFTET